MHQVAIEMFKVKNDLSLTHGLQFMKELLAHKANDKGTRSGDTFVRPHIRILSKKEIGH